MTTHGDLFRNARPYALAAGWTIAYVSSLYVWPSERKMLMSRAYDRDAPGNIKRRMLSISVVTLGALAFLLSRSGQRLRGGPSLQQSLRAMLVDHGLWPSAQTLGAASSSDVAHCLLRRTLGPLMLVVQLFAGVVVEHAIAMMPDIRRRAIHSIERNLQKRNDGRTTSRAAMSATSRWLAQIISLLKGRREFETSAECFLLRQGVVSAGELIAAYVRATVACTWQHVAFVDDAEGDDDGDDGVTTEARAMRTEVSQRRRWCFLRDLVVAPVCEEVVFRAAVYAALDTNPAATAVNVAVSADTSGIVDVVRRRVVKAVGDSLAGNGDAPAARSSHVVSSAVFFSCAHLHHIVRHYFSRKATRDGVWDVGALKYAASLTGRQALITTVFGVMNALLYERVCHRNLIAMVAVHAFCNAVGAPQLGFLDASVSTTGRCVVAVAYVWGIWRFLKGVRAQQ